MAKRKNKRTNIDLQNITHKAKNRVTWTPPKTRGELRCSGRASSHCSTSTTHHGNPATNLATSYEWLKDMEALATIRTHHVGTMFLYVGFAIFK